jgi:anti-sigma factor RsiW
MDCNESRPLIDADADGELNPDHQLDLAVHLRQCPACAQLAANTRARQAALGQGLPRFTAPAPLAEKIRASLRAEEKAVRIVPRRAQTAWPFWNIAGLAASLTLTLLVGYTWGTARARTNLLIEEAVGDHVRSLQASHLTDVTSTDQHTVKPWFAGKLDFSPPVVDLATAGFPLTGGRLEQFAGRPAAALVFHRRQHAINLFIWPAGNSTVATRRSGQNGYTIESWSQAGFNFLAISEIPTAELNEFTVAFREKTR